VYWQDLSGYNFDRTLPHRRKLYASPFVSSSLEQSDLRVLGADVDSAIWAMVEVCIEIVSTCLPTMRPIFNIIVRGYHCTSYEIDCSRCEGLRTSGGRGRWNIACEWPGSAPLRRRTGDRATQESKHNPLGLEASYRSQPMVESF